MWVGARREPGKGLCCPGRSSRRDERDGDAGRDAGEAEGPPVLRPARRCDGTRPRGHSERPPRHLTTPIRKAPRSPSERRHGLVVPKRRVPGFDVDENVRFPVSVRTTPRRSRRSRVRTSQAIVALRCVLVDLHSSDAPVAKQERQRPFLHADGCATACDGTRNAMPSMEILPSRILLSLPGGRVSTRAVPRKNLSTAS